MSHSDIFNVVFKVHCNVFSFAISQIRSMISHLVTHLNNHCLIILSKNLGKANSEVWILFLSVKSSFPISSPRSSQCDTLHIFPKSESNAYLCDREFSSKLIASGGKYNFKFCFYYSEILIRITHIPGALNISFLSLTLWKVCDFWKKCKNIFEAVIADTFHPFHWLGLRNRSVGVNSNRSHPSQFQNLA